MKIHFEPKDFLRKFKIAASIVSAKDAPILQNVRITADKRLGAILMATDTAVSIRIRVDCDVTDEGTVIVPTKQFRQILELETPQDWCSVTLSTIGSNKIQIESEQTDCQLDTFEADEFPILEKFSAESYHETSAEGLHTAIKRTIFAVEKNTVSALGGVCFENLYDDQQKDVIQLVATDGQRLALQTQDGERIGNHSLGLTVDQNPAHQTIVPVKCLKLLDKVLKEKSLDCAGRLIKIAVIRRKNVSQIMFQCGDVSIFSNLIAHRYPHWRRIVPELASEESLRVNVESGALLTAIKRVEAVTTGYESGIVLQFDDGQLTLEGHGKEVGKTKTTIPVDCKGKAIAMVDPTSLISMLKTLDSAATLTFVMNGYDPVCITLDKNAYLYLLMPVNQAEIAHRVEVDGMDIGKRIEQRRAEELKVELEAVKAGKYDPAEEFESVEPEEESEYEDEPEEEESEYEDVPEREDEPENEGSNHTAKIETWIKSGEQKESTSTTTSVSRSKDSPAKQEAASSKRKQFSFMD